MTNMTPWGGGITAEAIQAGRAARRKCPPHATLAFTFFLNSRSTSSYASWQDFWGTVTFNKTCTRGS